MFPYSALLVRQSIHINVSLQWPGLRLQQTAVSPQLQSIQVVDISFVAQRQFPTVQTSQLTSEVLLLPFVFRWSMPMLCRSCLPYLLSSTTGAQSSDSAEHRRGPAVAVHQVRRQFPVVVQKLIPMVLVTMGIPQLQYSLSGGRCPCWQLVQILRYCLLKTVSVVSNHRDSPAAVH